MNTFMTPLLYEENKLPITFGSTKSNHSPGFSVGTFNLYRIQDLRKLLKTPL